MCCSGAGICPYEPIPFRIKLFSVNYLGRLTLGDFELAFEGVCLGKWGEAERRLR